ncbi:MAG: metal-dependent hydrolase [Thermoplasmata archaeon]
MLYTHVIVGYAAVLLITRDPWLALFGGLGASLPDIDIFFKHRFTFHNLFFVFLVFGTSLISYISLQALYIALGALLHICCDSFTYAPVGLFYPYSKRGFYLNLASNRTKQFFIDSCFFAFGTIVTNAFFFYVIPH